MATPEPRVPVTPPEPRSRGAPSPRPGASTALALVEQPRRSPTPGSRPRTPALGAPSRGAVELSFRPESPFKDDFKEVRMAWKKVRTVKAQERSPKQMTFSGPPEYYEVGRGLQRVPK